jgi:hypothetical protein
LINFFANLRVSPCLNNPKYDAIDSSARPFSTLTNMRRRVAPRKTRQYGKFTQPKKSTPEALTAGCIAYYPFIILS